MKVGTLLEAIDRLVRPITEELDYEICHTEYVKENGEYCLGIYIGKDGGIALPNCEASPRRVSDAMDEKDPIKEAYFLEVSSPGLNRTLLTDDHFRGQIRKEMMVRFTKSLNGRKNVKGILEEVSDDSVIAETNDLTTIPKDKVKSANLEGEI